MTHTGNQRLTALALSTILTVLAPSSLLLACKVESVTLYVGATAADAAADGAGQTVSIPVGDTAYFYATCTVPENPAELDIEWQFKLDGDGSFGDTTTTSYDDTDNTDSDEYAPFGVHDNIAVRARLSGATTWVTSDPTCTVNAVKIEIVSPATASFPKYIGIDTGLTLISEITPAAGTGGTYTWSKVSGAGTATFSPSDDSTTSFSADTVGSYTVKVEYAIGEGTCSDSAGTIEVVDAKMIFKAGTPSVETSSVTRAESGAFEIVDGDGDPIPGATYANWAFDGDDDVDASDASHTDRTWSGTIVESGTASCDVTFGGNTAEVSKAITVNARSGWSVTPTCIEDNDPGWGKYPGYDEPFGLNRDEANKDPHIIWGRGANFEQGYTTAEVDGGPNNDVWYISACTFAIDRETFINRFIKWGTTGYPDPPNANWFEYNELQGVDVDGMLQGVRNHEGYGTGLNRIGHQALIEDEEDNADMDAAAAIEDNVGSEKVWLELICGNEVWPIDTAIFAATDENNICEGDNWGPASIYLYDMVGSDGWSNPPISHGF